MHQNVLINKLKIPKFNLKLTNNSILFNVHAHVRLGTKEPIIGNLG